MTPEELQEIRRYLHRNPELSNQEKKTQKKLRSWLEEFSHDGLHDVGDTGLLVFFKGKEKGKKILLRTDMDALPIQEINDFEYRSSVEGVSHKCGHDGHITIMLGVAAYLSEQRPERGAVCLLFQPAEENGTGARAVIEDKNFTFEPQHVFALHNLPGYKKGNIVCKKGAFTAAAKSVIFRLNGKTSHAAEPEKGINPDMAVSEILRLTEKLSVRDTSSPDFRLITTVHVHLGEKAYGISAGYAEVHFTLRSWDNETMEKLEKELTEEVKKISGKYKLKQEEEWLQVFFANVNEEKAYEIIKESAEENGLSFEERKEPFKWGEDFGLFTEKYSGAMFGIGAGENTPALHNPDYDFPDEIIPEAVEVFKTIIKKAVV